MGVPTLWRPQNWGMGRVEVPSSPPMNPTTALNLVISSAAIEALHAEIRACRRCVETGHLERAAPRAWGVAPAPFMVIGQAPGIRENTPGGEMYLGPAGKKMRGWFRDAGFTDDDFGSTIYMTAITKCFPGRLPGHSKDRAPSRAEQANCRPWLDRQIALVRPQIVILFGKMAIDTFLGRNNSLERCVGSVYRLGDVIYLPLPHSSGASTWLNDPLHRAQVERAIEKLKVLREAVVAGEAISDEMLISADAPQPSATPP